MPHHVIPTGRQIVAELVKEMEERLYPLTFRRLPPPVYHVYLHPDDYREVEGLAPLLLIDAQKALNTRVDELNNRSRLLTFVGGKPAPIDVPPGGWEVHIQPEANGDVERGEFRIESRLSLPAAPGFSAGVQTTRLGRTVVSGGARRSTATEEVGTESSGVTTPTDRVPDAPTDAGGHGFARLSYEDDRGPHLYVIRKDTVAIGRGGSAHWVDVQVAASARISRVHCRIRRDASGRFFLRDVSQWGTSINGQAVPASAGEAGERSGTDGREQELPAEARIQLADAVTLTFEVVPPQ